MAPPQPAGPAITDDLDRAILHCLQLDGRVAFRAVGRVLGVSEQTVARRYRRMRSDGIVRVVGLVDVPQQAPTDWVLRLRARSDEVQGLAAALGQRDDISWVTIAAGGTEVVASLRSPDVAHRDDLLMRRLPGSARLLDMTADVVLHRFVRPDGLDFRIPSELVDSAAARELLAARPARLSGPPPAAEDAPMLRALAHDGRVPVAELVAADAEKLAWVVDRLAPGDGRHGDARRLVAELARVTGWTPARAAQRLRSLLAGGRLYLDVDVALDALGYTSSAYVWLSIEPRVLAATGAALAAHPSVAFVVAVSGTANLMVVAILTDTGALYAFVDQALGGLDGVRQVEVSPILRWTKQAGTFVEGDRLRGLRTQPVTRPPVRPGRG